MDNYEIFGGNTGGMGWPDYFQTALGISVDNTPNAPNTVDTVPTNAIQSMQPVSADQTQSFSGFWQDLTKGVLGYAIAKDATKNSVVVPGSKAAIRPAGTLYRSPVGNQSQLSPLALLLGVGGLAYVLTRGA